MKFHRTLDNEFIEALNRVYDQPNSWWRTLVDSADVFLALRNNSLNAYAGGMSIGRIIWDKQQVRLLVHEEYLTLTSREAYVDVLAGDVKRGRDLVCDEKGYLANLTRIKKRAGRFAGDERRGTNKVACRVLTVLDMEAAFEDRQDVEPGPENEPHDDLVGRGRMDLVVLGPDLRLLIFEAKEYANAELRARGTPKVCDQLRTYHEYLLTKSRELETAYRNVLAVFSTLRGRFFERRSGHPNWVNGRNSPTSIEIDPIPRLLIFGYDGLQERGVAENKEAICQKVTIPNFSNANVKTIGGTTSIREAHLT